MRWLLLLLVVLNIFYYVWRQQEAPLKVVEVNAFAVSAVGWRTIQLLNEVRPAAALSDARKESGFTNNAHI